MTVVEAKVPSHFPIKKNLDPLKKKAVKKEKKKTRKVIYYKKFN